MGCLPRGTRRPSLPPSPPRPSIRLRAERNPKTPHLEHEELEEALRQALRLALRQRPQEQALRCGTGVGMHAITAKDRAAAPSSTHCMDERANHADGNAKVHVQGRVHAWPVGRIFVRGQGKAPGRPAWPGGLLCVALHCRPRPTPAPLVRRQRCGWSGNAGRMCEGTSHPSSLLTVVMTAATAWSARKKFSARNSPTSERSMFSHRLWRSASSSAQSLHRGVCVCACVHACVCIMAAPSQPRNQAAPANQAPGHDTSLQGTAEACRRGSSRVPHAPPPHPHALAPALLAVVRYPPRRQRDPHHHQRRPLGTAGVAAAAMVRCCCRARRPGAPACLARAPSS